jgi:Ca2+-binding RTX toxin-like protein
VDLFGSEAGRAVKVRRSSARLTLGLLGATLALAVAALAPPKAAAAFATFSNGVLTVHSSEGKVVPRCGPNGEITVTGATPDGGGNCRDLRRIEASAIVNATFDFSQLPANLGGGQGPIEIHAFSEVNDPYEISDDKFIGAAGHINIFEGGLGFDSMTGGDLNDTLNGGADSDKIDGGGGNDTVRGGSGGDQLNGGLGADSLFGGGASDLLSGGPGPDSLFGGGSADKLLGGTGRDVLRGGGGTDKLVGGPGRDDEKQ